MRKNVSINIKRFVKVIFVFICVWLMAASARASEADAVLKNTVDKLKAAPSVVAQFALTQDGRTANGSITASQSRFVMSAGDMSVWYNGKTQWTMSRQAGECNITEPTADELAQVNPFEVLTSYTKYYTAKALKAAAGYKKIQLTPKSKSNEVSSAIVTINAKTRLPSQITVSLRNGSTISVKVTSINIGKAVAAATFNYPAKKYPKIEVIDLR